MNQNHDLEPGEARITVHVTVGDNSLTPTTAIIGPPEPGEKTATLHTHATYPGAGEVCLDIDFYALAQWCRTTATNLADSAVREATDGYDATQAALAEARALRTIESLESAVRFERKQLARVRRRIRSLNRDSK